MKFQCSQSGNCCRKLKARNREEADSLSVSKGPVIPLCRPEEMTLALWDWEVKNLEGAKVIPLSGVYDFNSERVIVLQYTLDEGDCPFLRGNKCSIYEKRPLVCRVYPLETEVTGKGINFNFLECCRIEDVRLDMGNIIDYFGDIALNAIQYDLINMWQKDILKGLSKRGIIKIKPDYPFRKLKRMAQTSDKIGFSELILTKNILTEDELHRKILDFNSCADAKHLMRL